jgi:hypothetical protein
VRSARRRLVAPERVHQPVPGDVSSAVDQQIDEQQAPQPSRQPVLDTASVDFDHQSSADLDHE